MEFFSTAGIPGDKWTEGETMVPHVAPSGHFNSTMLYYPGTEELQHDEGRGVNLHSIQRGIRKEMRRPLSRLGFSVYVRNLFQIKR